VTFVQALRSAPTPLARWEKITLLVLTLVVAVSRLLALSKTMWDWDEALFASALRDYDVVSHHPHPPGFPLFILAAKMVRFAFHSDFRALQSIVLAGALLLFPLLFAFARELRLPFLTAAGGALLYVFLPNVWFYGGTAFSDIPANAILLAACTLLLRGCRSRRSYFAGALLLGLAAGFRPQTLLMGCAVSLLASFVRLTDVTAGDLRGRLRDFFAVIAIGALAASLPYAGAAYLSTNPPHGYLDSCAALRQYVRKVDSFLNPERPPLRALFVNFLVRPMRAGRISFVVSGLAALALLLHGLGALRALRHGRACRCDRCGRHRGGSIGMVVLTFLPFALFAWLMLDPLSVSRYSTAYVALHALLAAAAAGLLAQPLARVRPWLAPAAQAGLIGLIAADYAHWTWPAIQQAKDVSPPIRALDFVRAHPTPGLPLFVDIGMIPVAGHELGDDHLIVFNRRNLPLLQAPHGGWYAEEGANLSLRSHEFRREAGRLGELVRLDRYFVVNVSPVGDAFQLLDGWYGREWDGASAWHWASARRAALRLLPSASQRATLTLAFGVPRQMVGRETVEVRVNGTTVDRLLLMEEGVRRTYDIVARTNAYNEVELLSDRLYTPSEHGEGDARHLGVRLDGLAFEPR
jgi:hypothetical protein